MTRRAACSPGFWKHNLFASTALGAATILLGCGGGGGGGGGNNGGGNPQACGSPSGSTTVVVCGRVVNNADGSGVAGATISLRNAAGTVLTNGTGGAISAATDGNGSFIITGAPAAAVQYSADPLPGSNFFANMAKVNGAVYFYQNNNTANTSKCFPALKGGAALPAGDTKVIDTVLFPGNAPPPGPQFGCPR